MYLLKTNGKNIFRFRLRDHGPLINNLILDLAIYSDQNLCQNQNSARLLAECKNQTISWQHILIIFPIISRQYYLILVLSSLQCKNNCQNQIWAMVVYHGEIVKPKLDYVPWTKSEYVFAFCLG